MPCCCWSSSTSTIAHWPTTDSRYDPGANFRQKRRGCTAGLQELLKSDVLRDLLLREDIGIVTNMVEVEFAFTDDTSRSRNRTAAVCTFIAPYLPPARELPSFPSPAVKLM